MSLSCEVSIWICDYYYYSQQVGVQSSDPYIYIEAERCLWDTARCGLQLHWSSDALVFGCIGPQNSDALVFRCFGCLMYLSSDAIVLHLSLSVKSDSWIDVRSLSAILPNRLSFVMDSCHFGSYRGVQVTSISLFCTSLIFISLLFLKRTEDLLANLCFCCE